MVQQRRSSKMSNITIKEKKTQKEKVEYCKMKPAGDTKWKLQYNQKHALDYCSQKQLPSHRHEMQKLFVEKESQAHKAFDSAKNWSIMLKDELNDMRNDIMRKTKSNQIKRRLEARPDLVDLRQQSGLQSAMMLQRRDPNQVDLEHKEMREQFTDYIQGMVTRSNVNNSSARQIKKDDRKSLLLKIQQEKANEESEQDDNAENVSIKDIADYISKNIRSGWRDRETIAT